MPFDPTPRELSPEDIAINEALDRLLEFFGPNGENWCPDEALDDIGRRCIVVAPPVFMGPDGVYAALHKAAVARGFSNIPAFNDHPATHWSDVVALISEARR